MVKIDIQNNQIILFDELNLIKKSVFAFFDSEFKLKSKEKNKSIYEFNTSEEEVIKKICTVLEHYKIVYEFSNSIKEKQKNFFEREENFEKFSLAALKIRNNECDVDGFNNFKISLEKNMPNRTLYGLQFLSAYHLAFSQNACNFSVPGAGKTSIVYGAYAYLKNLDENNSKYVSKILVIGPLNSFGPWEDEFESCFGKKVDSTRIVGMNKEERKDYFNGYIHSELTLLSYATAASSVDDIIPFLKNEKVMVILDEAHKIKNTSLDAQIAPAILKMAKYASSRVVLTGTPAPNGYIDLFNLYKFIWPERNVLKFNKGQLNRLSKLNFNEMNISEKNMVEKLSKNMEPYFMRIRKKDFDNMPIPIENPLIIVGMDKEQEEIYNYLENDLLKTIDLNDEMGTFTKAKMIRLLQAATNPHLLKKPIVDLCGCELDFKGDIFYKIMKYNFTPKKFKICVEKIKEILSKNNEKVVIWCYFIDNIFLLKKMIENENIRVELLYGGTPVETDFDEENLKTREKIVREFNDKKSDLRVLIANPYAASESISLHKVCHNAIYLERNFNAATYIQSKDRIHRYGLKKEDKINYYYIASQNTIDEVVDERLKLKELRMQELIEKNEIPLFSNYFDIDIEINDIKELLKRYVERRDK